MNGRELVQTPEASEGQGGLAPQPMGSQRVGHDLLTEQQLKNQAKIIRDGGHARGLLGGRTEQAGAEIQEYPWPI